MLHVSLRTDDSVFTDCSCVGRLVEHRSVIIGVGNRDVNRYRPGFRRHPSVNGGYDKPVVGRGLVVESLRNGEFQRSAGSASRHEPECVVVVP